MFCYPREDAVWFLVRHGGPFRREASIVDGKPSSVFFRPEKYDVIAYDPAVGEIRISAHSRREKDLYREKFGQHLFGAPDFFPVDQKYTLEPLRKDGQLSLVCTDVDGMERIRLKEVSFLRGGAEGEIETHAARDVFKALESRGQVLPSSVRIRHASFQVKYTDSKRPRSFTIRTPHNAQYARETDNVVAEEWLRKRGFIIGEQQRSHRASAA